jgi:hypothetical protein
MSPGKPLRPRRGGGWVAWGGDACVALGGEGRRPSPHVHHPRPYGSEAASETTS